MRGTVVVFVKAPVAGRVKTRLGVEIGMARAAALFRIMMNNTIAEAEKGRWRTVLAVDPPSAAHQDARFWPRRLPRVVQGRGDLGERMKRVFDVMPPGPVVIIGADAPEMRTRHLREAFDKLRGADAVFGPAEDGGYWLIGLARRRAAPDLFDGVRWSTKHALKDTLKTLPEKFDVRMLETLRDIDHAADLKHLARHVAKR
ncbi:TIGR04282 family arsenosugar biosynthesis glycosyltransferase [Hyphococcus flavus]|uniref:TIGR04282 family arsenosugar biosynthesis glycosyltransferase n=1 Tax=Hyphococcus flavus TaxID=1866326 RepID=A0AAF0CHU2_9PROT|nr:TIGR04282 family arsenosugar biosynthesis glycosyltransferase [Hyphococcus flavus]WDI32262.1 TIGR04282 family arsenosugar biosynthesis glycosyltransferase [Hyphococcus flavus]